MSRTMQPMPRTLRQDSLPAGFTDRPATMDDLSAVAEICDANERRVIGETTGFSRRFRIFWTSPQLELDRDVRVIEDADGRVAGFVQVMVERPHVIARVNGFVDPDYFGRGLGSFLLEWAERHARELTEKAPEGSRTCMQHGALEGDELAAELMRRRGMKLNRHFVFMVADLDGPPEPPVWPEGIELRPVTWETHGRLISDADNEIFKDHWGSVPRSDEDAFAQLSHWVRTDPDTDTSLWFVAWAGKEIAGVSLCWPKGDDDPNKGYVGILGVRRPWRGKGLGLALLRHSFGEFYRRGQRMAALHADGENITGALRLYTKAGMRIRRRYDNFELELRPGDDLAVRNLPG